MKGNSTTGHLASLLTIIIWGTTFISTKILLVDFQPVEILFFRFVMGLAALLLVCPRRLKGTSRQQELTFATAGLCGICLYYLLENIALTYTMASNVGVIISVAPFFTAILSHLFLKEERPGASFFIGFAIAMAGIFLISFNGSKLELNPVGDLLALLAALIWACYSVLTKKISGYGYHTILTTRRIFCYGILFMIPPLFLFDFKLELARFANPVYLFNIIFLGLGASALCFVTWNFAVKVLGAVKTSIYIYMVPVITVVTSVVILHEKITALAAVGTVLTLAGLFLSEGKGFLKKGRNKMDWQNEKCVMVIDESLPLGIIANTAAIMGITLGKKMPEVVGADVTDQSGNEHLGIIEFPVPILRGSPEIIKQIREKLYQPDFQDLTVVDFSDLAQGCKTYDEFIEKMGHVPESTLQYFGVAICGAKKKVNKLTGSIPLLR